METTELHRGRLIDHIQLVVRNLKASRAFYTAVLEVLHVPMGGEQEDFFWADELCVSTADSDAAQGQLTGRTHVAFQVTDRAMVDAFHKAALAHGRQGQRRPRRAPVPPGLLRRLCPGLRRQHIEAVYHGAAKRSAGSVKITF